MDKMCIEKGNQQNIQTQPGLNYFYSAFSLRYMNVTAKDTALIGQTA
jgi:hypothetical protein